MEEWHKMVNVASRLYKTVSDQGIDSKIKAVVHDGASNMKEAGEVCTQLGRRWLRRTQTAFVCHNG